MFASAGAGEKRPFLLLRLLAPARLPGPAAARRVLKESATSSDFIAVVVAVLFRPSTGRLGQGGRPSEHIPDATSPIRLLLLLLPPLLLLLLLLLLLDRPNRRIGRVLSSGRRAVGGTGETPVEISGPAEPPRRPLRLLLPAEALSTFTILALACPTQNSLFLVPATPNDGTLVQPRCAHVLLVRLIIPSMACPAQYFALPPATPQVARVEQLV